MRKQTSKRKYSKWSRQEKLTESLANNSQTTKRSSHNRSRSHLKSFVLNVIQTEMSYAINIQESTFSFLQRSTSHIIKISKSWLQQPRWRKRFNSILTKCNRNIRCEQPLSDQYNDWALSWKPSMKWIAMKSVESLVSALKARKRSCKSCCAQDRSAERLRPLLFLVSSQNLQFDSKAFGNAVPLKTYLSKVSFFTEDEIGTRTIESSSREHTLIFVYSENERVCVAYKFETFSSVVCWCIGPGQGRVDFHAHLIIVNFQRFTSIKVRDLVNKNDEKVIVDES